MWNWKREKHKKAVVAERKTRGRRERTKKLKDCGDKIVYARKAAWGWDSAKVGARRGDNCGMRLGRYRKKTGGSAVGKRKKGEAYRCPGCPPRGRRGVAGLEEKLRISTK